jgi:hypothetical protein
MVVRVLHTAAARMIRPTAAREARMIRPAVAWDARWAAVVGGIEVNISFFLLDRATYSVEHV